MVVNMAGGKTKYLVLLKLAISEDSTPFTEDIKTLHLYMSIYL